MSHKLRSLKINLSCTKQDLHFCSHLRQLTNLTLLDMKFVYGLISEPFTELQKIESLSVSRFLIDSAGELMFPALTNLTHLRFEEHLSMLERFNGGVLEARFQFSLPILICYSVDDSSLCLHSSVNRSRCFRIRDCADKRLEPDKGVFQAKSNESVL